MKTGFIGLGSMGGRQAKLLAETSELTVYDVHPPALAAFEGKAVLAKSMADAGRDAEIVGVCVRDDVQVDECVDALLPVMSKESVLLIHSTVRPQTVLAAADRAAALGITVLDAPVTKTKMSGEGRFVFTMTGGDAKTAARVQPVLDSYSTDTLYVGPLGAAMALKIANNLAIWVEILVAREAFRIAEAAGVPTESMLTVMKGNGALTPAMDSIIAGRARANDPEYREFMESQTGIGEKDVALAAALGRDVGIATPIAVQARELIHAAMTDYFPAK